jgi:hypothetical protein
VWLSLDSDHADEVPVEIADGDVDPDGRIDAGQLRYRLVVDQLRDLEDPLVLGDEPVSELRLEPDETGGDLAIARDDAEQVLERMSSGSASP